MILNKEFFYKSKDKILKNTLLTTGYYQLNLFNGKFKQFLVHRLVAKAFIKNLKNRPQINHKDGNPANNNIKNLEWCNASENGLHSYRILGNVAWQKGGKGENMPTSKPILQKTLNGKLVKRWGCGLDAVRKEGFESSCISRCCYGKYKKHKGYVWEFEKK